MSSKRAGTTEDELLTRRAAHARWLATLLADPCSTASLTLAAYGELLDEALLEVAVEAHREGRTNALCWTPPPAAMTHPPALQPPAGVRPGSADVFGQVHPGSAAELVTCGGCGRKTAAGKFAYHLEKCLARRRTAGPGGTAGPRPSRRAGP